MEPILSAEQLAALLGRPLTSREVANLPLYLEIAQDNVEQLLCMTIEVQEEVGSGDEPTPETRIFDPREGYSTVYTDIFTDPTSVQVNDSDVTYTPRFFGNRNTDVFNSVVLATKTTKEVSVTAFWGFPQLPADLALLLAQAFAVVSQAYQPKNIKSKQVEDFRITYGDLTSDQLLARNNAVTIRKYSQCNVINVKSGKVCRGRCYCGHCV